MSDDMMQRYTDQEAMRRMAAVENALGLWYRGHDWPESIWWCAPKRCEACGKVTMVQGPAWAGRKVCAMAIHKSFERSDCVQCNPPPAPPGNEAA